LPWIFIGKASNALHSHIYIDHADHGERGTTTQWQESAGGRSRGLHGRMPPLPGMPQFIVAALKIGNVAGIMLFSQAQQKVCHASLYC
jgi:hypothetical protein